jgi:hypothetical protein
MHRLAGYRAKGPVVLGTFVCHCRFFKVNFKDSENQQHDVYGSVILALTQYFFDRRLEEQGNEM